MAPCQHSAHDAGNGPLLSHNNLLDFSHNLYCFLHRLFLLRIVNPQALPGSTSCIFTMVFYRGTQAPFWEWGHTLTNFILSYLSRLFNQFRQIFLFCKNPFPEPFQPGGRPPWFFENVLGISPEFRRFTLLFSHFCCIIEAKSIGPGKKPSPLPAVERKVCIP